MLSFIAERASEAAPALVRPGGEAMSYASLAMASSAVMQAVGARVGDVHGRLVGIAVSDSAGFVASVLAVLEAGGVVLPLDPRRGLAALELEAQGARAVAVIVGDPVDDRLDVVAGDARRRELAADACLALEAGGRRALISRAALGVGVDAIATQLGLDASSRVPLLGSLGHVSVLVGQALATLRTGGALLLVDPLPPLAQAEAMKRLGANVVSALPSTLAAMVAAATEEVRDREEPGAPAAPVLMRAARVLATGALDDEAALRLRHAFGGARLGCAYDRAEALRVAAAFDDEPGFADGGLGPLPGVACAIADDGLLELRSPTTMLGYLDDADATARALDLRDGARWLRTGDLARAADDGRIIVGAPANGCLLVGGERVDLMALERRFAETPGVREVALLAVTDQGYARLHAFVAGDALAVPRHPARVVTLASLPHRSDGTVDREALRRMASPT